VGRLRRTPFLASFELNRALVRPKRGRAYFFALIAISGIDRAVGGGKTDKMEVGAMQGNKHIRLTFMALITALTLGSGCTELPIPNAGAAVRVTRAAANGAQTHVDVSAARAAAIWPCLRHATEITVGTGETLPEGDYAIQLGDDRRGSSVLFQLESKIDLRLRDGRLFRSECLYDLVRDRRVARDPTRW